MNNTKRIWHMVSKLTGAPLQLPDPLMSVDSGLLAWHIALTSDNKQIQFQHMITFFCFGKGTTEPSITNQLHLQIDWSLVLLLFDHHAHTVHLYGIIREGSGWKTTSWPLTSTASLLPLIKLKAGNPLCPICTCLIKGRNMFTSLPNLDWSPSYIAFLQQAIAPKIMLWMAYSFS